MSLCIATSVPDGIILTSDSLQSINGIRSNQISFACGTCNTNHQLDFGIPVSFGTFPTAQKQHHLCVSGGGDGELWHLGLLNAGALNVGDSRVSKLVREFEKTIGLSDKMDDIASNLRDFFVKRVTSAFDLASIDKFNSDPLHFIFCGYDRNDTSTTLPKKYVIKICNKPSVDPHHGYGAAWVGRAEIPSMFNDGTLMKKFGLDGINLLFNSMNIQDAVDYNRFLTNTVIGFQKFAPMASDVGGEIEVGILRNGKEYHWVHRMTWD